MFDIHSQVRALVQSSEDYRDELSKDRTTAHALYKGDPDAVPSDEGRSRVVSKDIRAALKDVKPALMRIIMGSTEIVEYQPIGQGDEEISKQASDYVNHVVLVESNGRNAIEDAITDALIFRNGILRYWVDKRKSVTYSTHNDLDMSQFEQLIGEDEVSLMEYTTKEGGVDPSTGAPSQLISCRIKRIKETQGIKVAAVEPEKFLIHPDAIEIGDSLLVGIKDRLRRSDLVAMGYDAETVKNLPETGEDDEEEYEESARRDRTREDDNELHWTMKPVDYYELFVRVDRDEDGIVELIRMCYGGAISEKNLLEDEEVDDVPFAAISIERQPHQWEGYSLSDDLSMVQKVKTVIFRGMLDNLYTQLNQQPIYSEGAVVNPEALYKPEFGKPIRVQSGRDVREVVTYAPSPQISQAAVAMMDFITEEGRNRTGVSDLSAGAPQNLLQNVTATASAIVENSSIAQIELMSATIADGLRGFFRGLLKLVIRYQDRSRMVRLRDKWVEVDPRHWNSSMDCIVNTGLGAGTRERDMTMMQMVMGIQEKLLSGFGPDNPFVKPNNLYNTISMLIKSAGLRTPNLFVTEPDPQEVAEKLQGGANKPSPEMEKAQMQMQLKQLELQMKSQQMQADMQMKSEQMQVDMQMQRMKLQAEIELRREQMQAELALKREQLEAELAIKAQLAVAKADSGFNTSSSVNVGGEPG